MLLTMSDIKIAEKLAYIQHFTIILTTQSHILLCESGTNLLAKRGEVRRICLPSRGRSPRDGRQILLTSPSFARRLIRLLGWRSGISKTTDRISTL